MKTEGRGKEHIKQLEALQAQLPDSPPERMRAVFAVHSGKGVKYVTKSVKRLFGGYKFEKVPEEVLGYTCDMFLQMSETELAIIRQHRLDEIILEEVPLYTPEEIAADLAQNKLKIDAARDPITRYAAESQEAHIKSRKNSRYRTSVGDIMVHPYVRGFGTHPEAQAHVEKVKGEWLPRVRQLIEQYRDSDPNVSKVEEF